MRLIATTLVLIIGLLVWRGWQSTAAEPQLSSPKQASPADSSAAKKPFGLERRIPWTTSRVVGSPNPPPPYRVKRAFPQLTFRQPLYVIHEPGTDQLMVMQHQGGYEGPAKILRFKNQRETDQTELFLQLNRIAFGLTFHPQYAKNGYVYMCSNGPDGAKVKKNRLARYTVERQPPFRCDPKSELVILEWESNGHNGGDLAFGNDGYLYVSSGDGTSDSDTDLRGQDLSQLTAKILRIDVDHPDGDKPYSIPPDNPFVKRQGTRPETWAYGLRNPWRLTYDRKTSQLWVGNNGQDLWEQAFLVRRGDNYGWSVYEGSYPFQLERQRGPDPFVKPTVEHPHSESRSLTGGIVYHGSKFPELRGAYIYGDYSTGKIWGVRHDGTRITWHRELTHTRLQITAFGADPDGELLIVDHQGGLYELDPTPKDQPVHRFPTRLSETGLFTSVKDHQTDPALIPYSVNAPLWSDGADKERFIALPGTSQIDFTTSRGWNFADGAVLVKTFSLFLEEKKPASRRRIETRLLTKQQGEWVGYSYIWNDEQTDATLVDAAGMDRIFEIINPQSPGGRRKQTWHYPSRTECMVCHSRAANYVLGMTELQMNREHTYGAVTDNQLRALERIGVFRVNWLDHTQELRSRWRRSSKLLAGLFQGYPSDARRRIPETAALLDGLTAEAGQFLTKSLMPGRENWLNPLSQLENKLRATPTYTTVLPRRQEFYQRLADPSDAKADLNARARSYLHANCSQCHVMAGGGNSRIELEFTTKRDEMFLFGITPLHHTYGIAEAKLVAPGNPERSILLNRLLRRGPGQMPPLATSEVDREAVQMLRDWIAQLKP